MDQLQLGSLGKNWGWGLVAGICFVALGVVAWARPVASTVSLVVALGFFFLIGGFVRLIQAVRLWKDVGSGWRFFDSVLAFTAGMVLLRYPGSGMLGITIAMIFYFFMTAITKAAVAYSTRPLPGSGWLFVSAIASVALAIYMLATFPVSALWVPGALLGLEFIIYGASLIGVSFSLRNLHRDFERMGGGPNERREAA